MKIDSFFFLVLFVEITSCNAIDIFENLTMSKGVLTWVENFWSYNETYIDY